ncbi:MULTISPECIES: mechanosensitive ion channel domain-containing protein [Moorena]|uniref:Small-conductance mechanosensitive channel n=1 Tax=Moorena producens 3L TaxID=489825 RepID=F4Y276_9CYAN|nr:MULTISPECIES: mechanosensitive ion channel domain-containing protein [Moorena]NES85827.1 mechanosensitive ion channel [Moorena sp. SIO2B7]EGJ29368.1 small-conductance mechanosensitive channel [Moorena producens 3L]NEP36198.1 mechanosensitive ion channel [Moorena sp. SIO3B2]NEP67790.1 mechanosensitive ion channel [Moorena sp. SIO3A5]NER90210.1 mechanosensitive ion channel [Moorena sp. SIO3A2]
MENLKSTINSTINLIKERIFESDFQLPNIPVATIVIVVLILLFTHILRGLFTSIIIHRLERLTSGTETTHDDEFIRILKQPLGWLIWIGGLWLVHLVVATHLSDTQNQKIPEFLFVSVLFIATYILYRAAPLLGELLAGLAANTETELDDLFVPYFPKLFQIAAILIAAIKASEIVLGASAGALIGLLGGAGVALGLLFKDIVYDWCCTVIIYADGLYKPGDVIVLDGVSGRVKILNIGLRSTRLLITEWGYIKKLPNSKMISGIFANWSDKTGDTVQWGINLNLKIDGISAEQTRRICQAIKENVSSIDGLNKEKILVVFSRLEQNARVIKIRVFVIEPKLYYDVQSNLNLAVLEILENEEINQLHVYLRKELNWLPDTSMN